MQHYVLLILRHSRLARKTRKSLHAMGLKIKIHEIRQNLRNPISLIGPIISETCWNKRCQPPTLSGQRTWTVDEIEWDWSRLKFKF